MTKRNPAYTAALCLLIVFITAANCHAATVDPNVPKTPAFRPPADPNKARLWALGCSAILMERNGSPHDTLETSPSTPGNVAATKRLFARWWGVESRRDLFETLVWLQQEGHRKSFDADGQAMRSRIRQILTMASRGDNAKRLRIAGAYHESLGDKSIVGWDMARYISLCRWGYTVGYLSEDEAWEMTIPAARLIQKRFTSWRDIGENYLIGRDYWDGDSDKRPLYQDALMRLMESKDSPWANLPWNTDLGEGPVSGQVWSEGTTRRVSDDVGTKSHPCDTASNEDKTLDPKSLEKQTSSSVDPVADQAITPDEWSKGRTITVGHDADTIMAAMDMANLNDTVYVPRGLYMEDNIVLKKGVRLLGDGIGKTVIRGRPKAGTWIIRTDAVMGRIEGLTVEQTGAKGKVKDTGGIFIRRSHVPIVSCEARNTAGIGILVLESGEIMVKDCVVTGNLSGGIFVSTLGHGTKVIGCTVRENGARGIEMHAEGPAFIEHNVVEKNTEGIFVSWQNTQFAITGNIVRYNAGGGIMAYDAGQVTVRNNLCEDNGAHGIVLWHGIKEATVTSNHCRRNGDCGIQVEHAVTMISSNICENNESGIIMIDVPRATIEKNLVANSDDGSGIRCKNVGKADVRRNQCTGNVSGGIAFEGRMDANILDNTCHDNGAGGIIFWKASGPATVTGNSCTGGDFGISVRKSRGLTIRNNILNCNRGHGLDIVDDSQVKAESNTCRQNSQFGVYVDGSGTVAVLESNECIDNRHGGICFVRGASGQIKSNTCSGSLWCGIGIRDAATSVTLTKNRCNDNGAWGIIAWAGAKLDNLPTDNITEGNFKGGVITRDQTPDPNE